MSPSSKSMETKTLSGRLLKRKVRELLGSNETDGALSVLCQMPPRRVVNPLISLFNSPDQRIRWAAVTAMGPVVAKMAGEDMEGARVIMRRLMWSLNDESGGIGWGCPEAMGEILARHEALAREFTHILVSYTREEGNYLEHEALQRGLLWGIGRLALVRPDKVKAAEPDIVPYLRAGDGTVRGLAAWVSGILKLDEARPELESLLDDDAEFQIYTEHDLEVRRVRDAAAMALRQLGSGKP